MQTTRSIATATEANPKMKTHGFRMIHAAEIRPRKSCQERHPFTLEVTGTWIPAAPPNVWPPPEGTCQLSMRTKAVAAGTRQQLERFARENKLPINHGDS